MLDLEGLTNRINAIAQAYRPGVHVARVRPLMGGASGLTFMASLDSAHECVPVVVKVAPPGLPPTGHRDVLRQAHILRSLSRMPGIYVPAVLFADGGTGLDAPPFYVMEHIPGASFEPNKDQLANGTALPPAEELDARGRSAVAVLAKLHALPLRDLDVKNEPVRLPVDELLRWAQLLDKLDEKLRGDAHRLLARLSATIPSPMEPGLLHGDFRLGNILCQSGKVVAVVDWEIWSIGDRRVDLAWFLLTAEPDVHPFAVRRAPGLPTSATLLGIYEESQGVMPALNWFRALALLKMAGSTAVIVRNARRAGDPDGRAVKLAPRVPIMIERAFAAIS